VISLPLSVNAVSLKTIALKTPQAFPKK
jgi:hypothetical protein